MKRKLSVIEHDSAKKLNIYDRQYMLMHDDHTWDIIVEISDDFSNFKSTDKKDEVFGKWSGDYFCISCYLDNKNSRFSTKTRFEIFNSHIKNSLISMMKAERLFEKKDLKKKVREYYFSKDPQFNTVIEDKTLEEYIWEGDDFSKYSNSFDYSKLKKIDL